MLNKKWKILNPKHQTLNKSKYLNPKRKTFLFLSFEFWYCVLFSISDLEFRIYKSTTYRVIT